MDTYSKSPTGRWRWWFVGLAGLLLLTQLALGVAGGWDLNRTLGVVTALAIGLSFLLQIRDIRRRQPLTDRPQKASRAAAEYDRSHITDAGAQPRSEESAEGHQGRNRE